MFWIIATIAAILLALPIGCLILIWLYIYVYYLSYIARIFQERPLFAINRGQPIEDAEDMWIDGPGNSRLRLCVLPSSGRRRGVVLFAPEYGSNRWSCLDYSHFLRDAGYDIVSYEPRGQGESDSIEGYKPLHWVTDFEVADAKAVLGWMKRRYAGQVSSIGVMGISKGAGAATIASVNDPFVECLVTDGMFAVYTTVVPYMRQWVKIYSRLHWLQNILPNWFYGSLAKACFFMVQRERSCRFPSIEGALRHLGEKPTLMIHGEKDSYIRPVMAEKLHLIVAQAGYATHDFWLAPGARHNEAYAKHPEEYRTRVLAFLDDHLPAVHSPMPVGARGG
ncbi:MAG: alpha/beta hydrolase [Planctomycetota bacterium]